MLGLMTMMAMAAAPDAAAPLRMNDLQAVGTHNSYKQAIPADELAAMVAARGRPVLALDYAHRSLAEQLDAGARQLEIDVVADPAGGLYARPLTALGKGVVLPPRVAEALARPGFKTLHMPDVDFRSSCVTFIECLAQIRAWSDAHRHHAPILILLNAKEGAATVPGGVTPPVFDEKTFDALDAEIRGVFGPDRLIDPDLVRGKKATLREAVLAGGWPTLEAARGK
ncbi:MAG: Ca2+-dependent phosphoinositide-specific phospholipase C, partial [Caulobacter sp.]